MSAPFWPVGTGGAIECGEAATSSAGDFAPHSVGADVPVGPLVRFHRTASFAVTPQPLLRRPSSSQTPHSSPRRKRQVSSVPLLVLSNLQTLRWFAIWFRLACQKKYAKRDAGCESDCTASHRMAPSKNAAASTRESPCKAILQRRLRGDNAPIGSSCHAGRWQNTLPWNAERIYVCADGANSL